MMPTKMSRYKCHKVVHAAKISAVGVPDKGTVILWFDDLDGQGIVPESYVDKHKPQVGGYYVKYEDGYESYSPAEAFEAGYTLIEEA